MPPPVDGGDDDDRQEMTNGGGRAETIRAAVAWLAERQAEVKAINAEIAEYRQKHIKGDLGFKLADWNAFFRVSQLEVEDRDQLIDTLREGFEALGIGEQSSFLGAMEQGGDERRAAQSLTGANVEYANRMGARAASGNGHVAEKHDIAWETGFADGLAGNVDHEARWPAGEYGHADYHLGHAEGEKQLERSAALAP